MYRRLASRAPHAACPRSHLAGRVALGAVALLAVAWINGACLADSVAFGRYRSTIDDLRSPAAVAVDAGGRVFICEPHLGRVRIFDASGGELAVWAEQQGELAVPSGIATAPGGLVFVAEAKLNHIAVLEDSGQSKWTLGRAWGMTILRQPHGLAVAGDRVVVADTGNDCVRVFGLDGTLMGTIGRGSGSASGGGGAGPGALRRPLDVAVDDEGFVYVADCDNHRVQKFSADGSFVKSWGDWGAFPGLFSELCAIEHYDGRLYVADRLNHRVQVFDLEGEFLYQWGMHPVVLREGEGKIHYPNAIAMHPRGEWAVVGEAFENRCQLFAPVENAEELRNELPAEKDTQSHFGLGIAAADGRLAVWEAESRAVYVFDTRAGGGDVPILITRFGQPGGGASDLGEITSMQILPGGERLLVNNATSRSVQVFDLPKGDGRLRFDPFLAKFVKSVRWSDRAAAVESADQSRRLRDMAPAACVRDADGRLYVLDTASPAVLVLDDQYRLQDVWRGEASVPCGLERPIAAALTSDGGKLLVVDEWARCVHVFTRDGAHLDAWVAADTDSQTKLVHPVAVAVAADDLAYVVDAELNAVIAYDPSGRVVRRWGELGMGAGDFHQPWGVAIGDDGRIFVLDHGNHRVQAFRPDGTWLAAFSAGSAYTPRRPVPDWMEQWRPPSP